MPIISTKSALFTGRTLLILIGLFGLVWAAIPTATAAAEECSCNISAQSLFCDVKASFTLPLKKLTIDDLFTKVKSSECMGKAELQTYLKNSKIGPGADGCSVNESGKFQYDLEIPIVGTSEQTMSYSLSCSVTGAPDTPGTPDGPPSGPTPSPDAPIGSTPVQPFSAGSGGLLGPTQLENPIPTTSIPVILGGVAQKALGIIGSLALFAFIIGGFMWITSAGNPERIKRGTETMVWAAVGIFIIFSSYAILSLVLEGFGARQNSGAAARCAPVADFDQVCQTYTDDCRAEYGCKKSGAKCVPLSAKPEDQAAFCAKFAKDATTCNTVSGGGCQWK